MDEILKKYSSLSQLNVSRETFSDFEKFISMIIEKNDEINLISRDTCKNETIRERHIVDSAQVIDLIDLKSNTSTDLGTGGGFPGIIVAIMLKHMKKDIKIDLYEKSHHKCLFLSKVSGELNLDTNVIKKDIFKVKELNSGTIIARAFKPLPIVLELVNENFNNFENLIIFMGKSGKQKLEETLRNWELDYETRKSITNDDSFLVNIKNIKKKN